MSSELTINQPSPNPQNSQPSSPAAQAGATGAVNKSADAVVVKTANADGPNVGEDDSRRREAAGANNARNHQVADIPRLQDLKSSGLKTVVGFDVSEANHIYIRVQDANTGQEIAQIPSKEFVQFLKQRFEELSGSQSPRKRFAESV